MPSEYPFYLYANRDVADRAGMIGGSSWLDVFEVPPYGCSRRFWLSYKGEPEDEDYKPGPWLSRGKDLEEFILKKYANQIGCKVVGWEELAFGGEMFRGDVPDWSWPHLDGVVFDHPQHAGKGVIDAKCLFPKSVNEIIINGVTLGYKMQMMHYMASMGYKWGVLAILDFMNWEMHEVYVEFDQELWDKMKAKAESTLETITMGHEGPPPILPRERNGKPNKVCTTCKYFIKCTGGM